jgi:hypothetical protein
VTGVLIVIGVFIALVLVMGVRHDRRQRGMTKSPDGRRQRGGTRLENQTRADEWGA